MLTETELATLEVASELRALVTCRGEQFGLGYALGFDGLALGEIWQRHYGTAPSRCQIGLFLEGIRGFAKIIHEKGDTLFAYCCVVETMIEHDLTCDEKGK